MRKYSLPLIAFFFCVTLHYKYSHVKAEQAANAVPEGFELTEKYKKWMSDYKQWFEFMKDKFSATHWETYVTAFVNVENALPVFENNYEMQLLEMDGADEDEIEEEGGYQHYPVGTIFAKENWQEKNGEKTLATVTFMNKRAEDDWHYLEVMMPNMVLIDSDREKVSAHTKCIECHAEVKHRDYIFHTYYEYEQ